MYSITEKMEVFLVIYIQDLNRPNILMLFTQN